MQIGKHPAIRNAVRIVSGFSYVASMLLPAFGEPDSAHKLLWWKGYSVLAMGWLGIFNLQFAWLGNLAIAISLIRPSKALSAILTFCAISALLWHELPTDATTKYIRDFGPGYYAWLFALIGAAVVPFLGVPLKFTSVIFLKQNLSFRRPRSSRDDASTMPRARPNVQVGPLSRWVVTIMDGRVVALDPTKSKREIALDSLDSVIIETTGDGPYRADIWWLLYGPDGKLACAFPQGPSGETMVVETLMSLPDFDHRAMIEAETALHGAIFPVWKRRGHEKPMR